MPLSASAGTIGSVPPRADQRRPPAERALERVQPELHRLRVGRDEPRRRRRPQLDLQLGTGRRGLTQDALDLRRDLVDLLPRREPDRHVRDRLDRQHRLLEDRRAGLDAVHVERRLGERAPVELARRVRVLRPGALLAELVGARRQLIPAGELLVGRLGDAFAQRLGERPVVRDGGAQRLHQRVRGVERGAAVHAGVQVALAGAERDVEVRHPARGDIERRHVAPDHPAVEDDRRVRPALVGLEELDDRVAAGLLLAVAAEPDVDRQLAGLRKLARRRQQHVELALVVD